LKEKLTSADLIEILEKMAKDIMESQDAIRELDAAMGDGDLGVTTTAGFRNIRDGLAELKGRDVGTILIKSGMNYNKSMASTFGVLLATALIRAGNEVKEKNEADLFDLVKMAQAAVQGVRERGKAQLGDKTMLDVLMPATEALEKAYKEGRNTVEGLEAALSVGEKCLKSTIQMKAKVGRSSWLGDKTLGKQDPGATVVYLMLKSFTESVKSIS